MFALVQYATRRLLGAIPLLLGLVTIVFFLSRLLPGDATDTLLSPSVPASVREQLKVQLGLDRPLHEQYFAWLRSVLAGDFGVSFTRNQPVLHVVGEAFPNSVILGGAAFVLEVLAGIFIALPTFLCEGRRLEKLLANVMLGVYAVPSFWIGMVLLVIFSYGMGLFPASQMYDSGEYGSWSSLLHHLVLPAVTVATPAAAGFARYLRSTIATTRKQEYVLFARSMGLSEAKIFRSYILPNSISPLISLAGVEIGILLAGVLVTETLFSWPGMGQLMVHAIFARDYPVILGCTVIAGVAAIAGNLLADVTNALVNPRIRTVGDS